MYIFFSRADIYNLDLVSVVDPDAIALHILKELTLFCIINILFLNHDIFYTC